MVAHAATSAPPCFTRDPTRNLRRNEPKGTLVLALTDNAIRALKEIVSASRAVSDRGGVRISAMPTGDGESTIRLMAAENPEHGDLVIEAGARVFVDEALLDYLEDKTLDADADARGLQFVLTKS